jgi:hypothetical protein
MARQWGGASNWGADVTVGAGSPLDIANNGTVAWSGWFYFTSFVANSNILCKGYNGTTTAYEFTNNTTTQLVWRSFVSGTGHGVTYNHSLSTNTWYHFYGDYDGSAWHLYQNGSQVSGSPATDATGPQSNAMRVTMGCLDINGTIGNFSNEYMAEVAFWSGPLSVLEISALAKGLRCYNIKTRTLLGYWPLDGLQSPEPDLSFNEYNLTLINSPPQAFGPPLMQFTPRWPLLPPLPPPPLFILMPQIVT